MAGVVRPACVPTTPPAFASAALLYPRRGALVLMPLCLELKLWRSYPKQRWEEFEFSRLYQRRLDEVRTTCGSRRGAAHDAARTHEDGRSGPISTLAQALHRSVS